MPYISPASRTGPVSPAASIGELNYRICKEVIAYLENHHISYAVYNEIIGVLECAKLEVYRRKVAPYEDTAIAKNGDIF